MVKGGALLISVANIIELGRKEGEPLKKLKSFFENLGEHWFPLEVNPLLVIEREIDNKGAPPYFDQQLITNYYPYIHEQSHSLSKVIDLISGERDRFDKCLARAHQFSVDLTQVRKLFQEKHPSINPDAYLVLHYDSANPTSYSYNGLMRASIEGKLSLTGNDVVDIWHASTSLVYADIVVLDRRWVQIAKDKLKKLPGLIQKLFKVSELALMIGSLENAIISE